MEKADGTMIHAMPRRTFLARTAAAGLFASPLLAAACGGSSSSSGGSQPLNRPLAMAHDAAVASIFKPAIDQFNKEYAPLSVRFSGIAQNYEQVLQQRFAAGSADVDVCFSDPGYQELWYENGWIQPLDGLPGIDQLNADINNPDILKDLQSSKDGKQIALPYYTSGFMLHYIQPSLEKAGIATPTTWDEFEAACAKLKKDGVYATPYAAFWDKDFYQSAFTLISCAMGNGMTQLFDASAHPTFDTDPVMIDMLTRFRRWYKAGYVPTESLGSDYTAVNNVYAGGKAAFTINDAEAVQAWNTPSSSKVVGQTKMALMPGATHNTMTTVAKWHMTSTTPNRGDAWELLKFLSWKDKHGAYYVPITVLVGGFGVQAPWKGLASDPAYKKALSFPGMDFAVLQQQVSLGKVAMYPADRESWFSGFMNLLTTNIQLGVLGQMTPEAALKGAADYARQHSTS